MAVYRAIFKVDDHNYSLDGAILESESFASVWRYAYSKMRRFMREMKGTKSTMHISFRKRIYYDTDGVSVYSHITLISGYVHDDNMQDCDRILGFERNGNEVYVIRGEEA